VKARAAIALVLVACAVPYQPARLELTAPPDAETEERILAVFMRFFPRFESILRAPLRAHSTWTDDRLAGETPVQNRGFLAITQSGAGATVEVVVEQQALRQVPFALPAWHAVGGNRALEEQLVEALETELGLQPPAAR
jgi:hypothetical protein